MTGKAWKVGLLALVLLQAAGCAAMMMGGGGGYEPPDETCTQARRDAGLCK